MLGRGEVYNHSQLCGLQQHCEAPSLHVPLNQALEVQNHVSHETQRQQKLKSNQTSWENLNLQKRTTANGCNSRG